jgi:predicted metal-binding membrane protein
MAESETSARRGVPPWPTNALRLSIAVILVSLVALAALAWVTSARQARGGDMAPGIGRLFGGGPEMESMESTGMDMGSSSTGMALPLFLSMWVTMMVAMMFPAVAPMVIGHWRLTYRRGGSPLAVVLFASGYLFTWAALGVVAFALYRALLSITPTLTARSASLLAGGILLVAGAYQFTPLKSLCLKHCRNPLDFLHHWRPGVAGAARMGVEHGLYCVGCCWGLMLVLFAVGLANLAWMGILAAVIFVEKIAPFGWTARKGVGAALAVLGGLIVAVPALLGADVLGG